MNEVRKKEAEEWFDRLIEKRNAFTEVSKGAGYYEIHGLHADRIQMRYLEAFADALGLTVTYNPNWDDGYSNMGIMSAEYKGYSLFELWDKESN